jgi:hypothetical protein
MENKQRKYTRKEIKEFYKWLKNNIGWIDHYEISDKHQAITLELLELQIAKKPVLAKIELGSCWNGSLNIYKCSNCNSTLIYGVNYCNHCGQRTNWNLDKILDK